MTAKKKKERKKGKKTPNNSPQYPILEKSDSRAVFLYKVKEKRSKTEHLCIQQRQNGKKPALVVFQDTEKTGRIHD